MAAVTESTLLLSFPSKQSLIRANAVVMAPPPPNACTILKAMNTRTSPVKQHATFDAAYRAIDAIRTFLRPYLSLIGPRTRMLTERTSMNRYSDMFITDSVVLKSTIITGSPERYMSVDSGPNMLRSNIRSISGRRPSLVPVIGRRTTGSHNNPESSNLIPSPIRKA